MNRSRDLTRRTILWVHLSDDSYGLPLADNPVSSHLATRPCLEVRGCFAAGKCCWLGGYAAALFAAYWLMVGFGPGYRGPYSLCVP